MPVQQPGQLQLFRPRARIRLVSNLQEVRQHVVLREKRLRPLREHGKAAVFLELDLSALWLCRSDEAG